MKNIEMKGKDIKPFPCFSAVIQKQGEFIRHVNVAILTLFWRIGEHVSLTMHDLYQAAIEELKLQNGNPERVDQPFDLLDKQELKFYSLYHHLFGNPKFPAVLGNSVNWEQLRKELLRNTDLSAPGHQVLRDGDPDNFASLQNNIDNFYSDDFFVSFEKLLNIEFDESRKNEKISKDAEAGIYALISDFKKDKCNQLSMQLNIIFWQIGQCCIDIVRDKDRVKDSAVILSQYNALIFSETYLNGMIAFAKQYSSFDQAVSIASSYYWHQIEEILSGNNQRQIGSRGKIAGQSYFGQSLEEPRPHNTPRILSRTETEKTRQVNYSIKIIEILSDPDTTKENNIFSTQAFRDMYSGTTNGIQITHPRTSASR